MRTIARRNTEEPLKTLTHTATFLMEYHLTSASKEADYQKRFTQVYGDGLRVITDRIYIADEIKNIEVYDRWTDAIKRLGETNDFDAFNDRFERLRNDIVKSARKSHRS